MPETRKVEIRKQTRLFDDFFKVDEILVAHEQRDGTMSSDQRRLVFERGDAVAALLYEPDTGYPYRDHGGPVQGADLDRAAPRQSGNH